MKRLLPLLFLFTPSAFAQSLALSGVGAYVEQQLNPGWTFIQQQTTVYPTDCGKSGNITSCTFTVLSTAGGSQSAWALALYTDTNVIITSASDNGTHGSTGWTTCPNTSECHSYNSRFGTDIIYKIGGDSGVTSVTVNFGSTDAANTSASFTEVLAPSGYAPSFDIGGSSSCSSSTSCPGPALTLAGTDAVLVFTNSNNNTEQYNQYGTGYGSPWITTGAFEAGIGLNISSYSTLNLEQTSAGPTAFSVIAFKSTAGLFTVPMPVFSLVTVSNTTSEASCTPTCPALTIPSTTAGDLILLILGSEAYSKISSVSDNAGGGSEKWSVPKGAGKCPASSSSPTYAISCAYVYGSSSVGGVTSVTPTVTSSNSTNSIAVLQFHRVSGSWSVDTQNSVSSQTNGNPPVSGPSVTISGANDLGIECFIGGGGPQLPTYYPGPPYGASGILFSPNSMGAACYVLLNTPTAPTPTWFYPGEPTVSPGVMTVWFK